MILRLDKKNIIDVYDFIRRVTDKFHELYITIDKQRYYLTDLKIIEKTVKNYILYGLYENGLKGVILICYEKGFRPYVKILSQNRNIETALLKFLLWNYSDKELFIKLKKENPLVNYLQLKNKKTGKLLFGFEFLAGRDTEILLIKKAIKKEPRRLSMKEIGDNNDDDNRKY